jgi:hypothetical protein
VYRLRVVLAGISPLIWRHLLVTDATPLAELHAILQTAFDWSDEHLHRFTIHAVEYGLWREGRPGFCRDARTVSLAQFGLRPGERFSYEYNFFDAWLHDIRVEQILPRQAEGLYPSSVLIGLWRDVEVEPVSSHEGVDEFCQFLGHWGGGPGSPGAL